MALETILLGLGGSVASKMIAKKFGVEFGDLADVAIDALAGAFGVESNEVAIEKAIAESTDSEARQKISVVNADLIMAKARFQNILNEGLHLISNQIVEEKKGHWFGWAWRPGWMWLLGLFWFWEIIGLHSLNAIFKTSLPPIELQTLVWVTVSFQGLYMGGHTIKDAFDKWSNKRSVAN